MVAHRLCQTEGRKNELVACPLRESTGCYSREKPRTGVLGKEVLVLGLWFAQGRALASWTEH
jgi:hypothetical protein